ncbi:MAG: hypothetical protein QME74_00040 [Candidatus Edwardsbacteria bacterium]|nr:hypothetical protein [Candidatus Edwardsbacteria bacterium]
MFHSILTFLAIVQFSGQPALMTGYLPKRLTVGDRFVVSYTVTCANRAKVLGPLADSLGAFILTGQKLKTKTHQGYNDNIYTLSFAGFKPGESALPPLRFLIQTGDKTDTLTSDSAKVIIASVLSPKAEDINEIKPAISFPNHWLWLIPAAVILLAVAVYLGWILYKKLQRVRELALAPLPAWEEALWALNNLPYKEWLAEGQVQKYYYSLSEILKRYIERRFGFNAVEQTTTEILASMKRDKTPRREEFGIFLTRADLVKYAKFLPPAGEQPQAIEQVRELVKRTTPDPEPVGAEKSAANSPGGK